MATRLSATDRLVGGLFWCAWRLAGLLALPALWLLPKTRSRLWRVPGPEPGWTWIHGASLGEHQVVRALLPGLPAETWRTRMSFRTPVPGAAPAPLDVPGGADRWIRHHRPGRLILVEAELWPGWLVSCRRLGIPVAVVHARESRGTRRWRRLGPLWRWLTQDVTWIRQEETGDLKAAAPPPPPSVSLPQPLLVAASTRRGDEERILEAWSDLEPRPTLLLAPRHLRRVEGVVGRVQAAGFAVQRRSAGPPWTAPVVVLDTLGELAGLLTQAQAAVIGGTWDPAIGGHSPAEATAAGVPVVGGPARAGNPAAWAAARDGTVASDPSELTRALAGALAAGRAEPDGASAESVSRALDRLPGAARVPEQPARPLLAPLVPLVRAVGSTRRGWRGAPERVDAPVVSVGGLTAGGSGKTPVVAWLAAQIPGAWVVARGYRRAPHGPALRMGHPGESPGADLGDELEMLRRRGIPVVSAPDRVAGARAAAAAGARLILIDDGFQHRRLHRDLDVVCLDQRWPGGEGPIPVGTRREPWAALHRADGLWLHNAPTGAAAPEDGATGTSLSRPTVRSHAVPHQWRTPDGPLPLDAVQGGVAVFAGLARPEGLLSSLVRLGLRLDAIHLVGDHRPLGDLPVGAVLSEKDAARLPADAPVRVLEMRLEVEGAGPLLDRIRELSR